MAASDHIHSPTRHWTPSTAPDALLLFLVATVAVVGLCGASAAASRKWRRNGSVLDENNNQVLEEVVLHGDHDIQRTPEKLFVFSWVALKKAMATSSASFGDRSNHKVADNHEQRIGEQLPAVTPATGGSGRTPVLPLWQRRILMGGRCELPRFSGLILYDERGRLLHGGSNDPEQLKVKSPAIVTTLKDLL